MYKKGLRVSSATNKSFDQGEIVNFLQIDARKIEDLASAFPDVARLPLILIYCLIMLYYYFKWTLYGAVGALILTSLLNYFLAIWQAKWQKDLMEKVDIWMNALTEIVNNIKVIKLNSYTNEFMNWLLGKRKDEVNSYVKKLIVSLFNWISAIMIPPFIILICFSLLFAHGFELSVADAFAAVFTINMLRGPMRWMPYFIGELM